MILTSRNAEAGQKVADEIKAGGAKVRCCAGSPKARQGKHCAAVYRSTTECYLIADVHHEPRAGDSVCVVTVI